MVNCLSTEAGNLRKSLVSVNVTKMNGRDHQVPEPTDIERYYLDENLDSLWEECDDRAVTVDYNFLSDIIELCLQYSLDHIQNKDCFHDNLVTVRKCLDVSQSILIADETHNNSSKQVCHIQEVISFLIHNYMCYEPQGIIDEQIYSIGQHYQILSHEDAINLKNNLPKFPYGEMFCNEYNYWFSKIKEDNALEKDKKIKKEFKIMVFNSTEKEKTKTEGEQKYIDFKLCDGYWYHGTDHRSAVNIFEDEIKLKKGQPGQDFSDGDGFYLSSDFNSAKKWSGMKTKPAVIIYNVKKLLDKYTGIDLTARRVQKNENKIVDLTDEKEQNWNAIIKHNRSKRKWSLPNNIKEQFNKSDYIIGPRSGDGSLGTKCPIDIKGMSQWQPYGYIKQTSQLCIRNTKMAAEFGHVENIEGIIFY